MLLYFFFPEVLFDPLPDLLSHVLYIVLVICELVVSFFRVVDIYKLNKSISEICPGLILLSIVYTGSHSCCLISLCVYLSFNCFAGYCP